MDRSLKPEILQYVIIYPNVPLEYFYSDLCNVEFGYLMRTSLFKIRRSTVDWMSWIQHI